MTLPWYAVYERTVRILRRASAIAVVAASFMSSAAFANVTVTNYSLPDSDSFGAATTEGYNYYTGPIVLSTTSGSLTVYCADLNHTIYPGTTYTYAYGNLTENGLGQSISQPLSNELGQIADIGKTALAGGDDDLAAAAQAAIWGLEYNTTPTFADPLGTIATDYSNLVTATYANSGDWGTALIPVGEGWPDNSGATQQMLVGGWLGNSGAPQIPVGAPEASTWAMLLVGFAGLGFAAFRRTKNSRPEVAAL